MRVTPLQTDFSTGEISPVAMGRTDLDRFKSALAKCLNAIPVSAGPVFRRSGSLYANSTRYTDKATILIPFKFSNSQAYVIELGEYYMRLYYGGVRLETTPGVPYEPGFYSAAPYSFTYTPWPESALSGLNWKQSGDILYVTHPQYPPVKIMRYGHTDWRLQYLEFKEGPYLETFAPKWFMMVNKHSVIDGTTYVEMICQNASFSASAVVSAVTNLFATTYKITMTAQHPFSPGEEVWLQGNRYTISSVPSPRELVVTGANPTTYVGQIMWAAPFTPDDKYGRSFLFKFGSVWVRGEAVASVSGMVAHTTNGYYSQLFKLDSDVALNTITSFWKSSAFWGYGGVLSYGPGYPTAIEFHEDRLCFGGPGQEVHLSRTSDYENFNPIDSDGTVPADAAIFFRIPVGGVDPIRWMISDEKGLQIGTAASEFWLKGATQYEALSSTNISFKESTSIGSSGCHPLKAGKNAVYIDPTGKKLFELTYFYNIDGYESVDLSILASHILKVRVKQVAFQKSPYPIIWAVLEDGSLAGLSYHRDVEGLRAGWHKHIIGGKSDASGTQAQVESIAVIPDLLGEKENLWMIVKRWINGAAVKHVEFLWDFYVGDDDSNPLVQDDAYFVDGGRFFDFSVGGFSPSTSLTGLSHLNGETVQVFGDGVHMGTFVVSSGTVTLPTAVTKAAVGLAFKTQVQLCRKDVGSADGSALGKKQRTNQVAVEFFLSAGVKMGMDFNSLDTLQFDGAPDFFSGLHEQQLQSSHSTNARVCFEVTDPTPMMVLAISSQTTTVDKG
jgi:hypothetical protein